MDNNVGQVNKMISSKKVNSNHEFINDLVLKHTSAIGDIGLLHGSMGISIYLFHLWRYTGNPVYKEHAEILVHGIYKKTGKIRLSSDFENGLAGIAWGIEHLVRNGFLDADTNEILADLDDKIFQYLVNNQELSIGLSTGLLGYGFYMLSRLEGRELDKSSSRDLLLVRLMIDLVNRLYDEIEHREFSLREPATFRITWPLPLTLILLTEIRKLNIYNHKVDIILNRLKTVVLSIFPIKNSNRLFLLVAMESVINQVDFLSWKEYANLLRKNTNLGHILEEFPNKNISANAGVAGIVWILQMPHNPFNGSEYRRLKSKITHRLGTSTLWKELKTKKGFQSRNIGIMEGLSGIAFSMLNLAKSEVPER